MNADRPRRAVAGITAPVWAAILLVDAAFLACIWFGIAQPLLNAWHGR